MRHEELEVGMLVRANELSDDVYTYTTSDNNCEGIVEQINISDFSLRITKSADASKIGHNYDVEAKYFDIIKENTGMVVELKTTEKRIEFGYGDLLVFEKGNQVLVVSDTDGNDYRGIILGEYKPTSYRGSKRGFIEMLEGAYELGSLERVIKADKLKLMEI